MLQQSRADALNNSPETVKRPPDTCGGYGPRAVTAQAGRLMGHSHAVRRISSYAGRFKRLVTTIWIINVRFGPLCGLKSDISRGPRSAPTCIYPAMRAYHFATARNLSTIGVMRLSDIDIT
jgi:hypothetical protein